MGAVGGDGLVQGLTGSEEKVIVSIRLRPLNDKERARNDVSEWECVNNNTVIYRNSLSVSERSMYPTGYSFDRVFSFDCSTRQVYDEGAKDVALSVVAGINASIFAYGQTSSGKTYTMSGITEYTVADIYDYLRKHNEREFIMKFSAMEIYNESVRDLLSTDCTPLRLLDDPERGTIVEKLTNETLRDWNHFRELLSICEDQRQIGETSLNEASSRSHQILRLTIESSSREFKGNDKASSLSATVNFIDLAGSERASQTLSDGTRLKEGCHINRSLLTLGTVIRKLSKGRNGHVPYRDSKLTRILQSSLGGNARTAIICTLSPTRSHVEQSRNTLLFASCAKEVSTNAQVNVVISDKALVKKLQRELARLENEIRCPGTTTVSPDYSALLREKELQIEKLKKELSEVTLQRDAAQYQVKDLLRAAEEDRTSESVNLDQYYPKLRVRSSWDFEHQAPRALVLPHSQRVDSNRRSFDTSPNSDRQSSNSDENYYQIQDLDENSFPTDSSSPRFPVRIPNFAEIDPHQKGSKEYADDNSDEVCKEVRCIEVEESSTNRYIKTNISDSSPKRSLSSNVPSPEAKADISDLTLVENAASPNQEPGTPHFKKSEDPNSFPPVFRTSSPEKPYQWLLERDFSGSTCLKLTRSRSCRISPTANFYSRLFDREENDESTPPTILDRSFVGRPDGVQKKVPALHYSADIEPLSRNDSHELLRRSGFLENFSNGDLEERSARIDHREKFSRNGSEENLSRSSSQEKLLRDGSWEVSPTSGSHEKPLRDGSPETSLKIHSQEEKLPRCDSHENSSKRRSQAEISRDGSREVSSKSGSLEEILPKDGSLEISYKSDSQDKLSRDVSLEKLSRSDSREKLSRNRSQVSATSEAIDELKTIDITSSNDNETTNIVLSADQIDKPVNFPSERPLANYEVLKTEEDLVEVTRTVKDIGLDPIQNDMESLQWPSEFKRLQREIIELWHACNVSLVHRTYFLLLFRGDPTDSIYMEVELRRLSFIKDTFSRGNQTIEDGRTLTYASSLRSLFRERLMLSKQMKKKLSKHERENVYLKWGIGLNTKHRRLQLAHRLWADTKDMDRVAESSAIVVKLVSSGEPEQASKEMFGLRFTPRRTSRKYYGLAQGVVKSFL